MVRITEKLFHDSPLGGSRSGNNPLLFSPIHRRHLSALFSVMIPYWAARKAPLINQEGYEVHENAFGLILSSGVPVGGSLWLG